MLECVVNVSEGRDREVLTELALAAADVLLDIHADAGHNRAVFSLADRDDERLERGARRVAEVAVGRIDLAGHQGAHPRIGAVDVVPFVPLEGSTMDDALGARDRFATWAAETLGIPCFLYGPDRGGAARRPKGADRRKGAYDWPRGGAGAPAARDGRGPKDPGARRQRTLPDIRRAGFKDLLPDRGPRVPHPTAGAICVGARPVLVAFNLWLKPDVSVEAARDAATQVRSSAVRALGLDVGGQRQVSMNLIDPLAFGPAEAFDAVAQLAPIERAEVVGLAPAAVLDAVPEQRWEELDLALARTIERRLGPSERELV